MTGLAVDELRVDVGAAAIVVALTPEEVAHYVVVTAEVARARAVLVEAYRRLTDFVTPVRMLSEIAPAIDTLERWAESTAPYLEARKA